MYKIKAEIKSNDDDSFTAIASTEIEDRQGEVVKVDGWQLKNYKDNPVLLFMHDHTKPIGKALRVWIEKASGKPKLMFKGVFSDATDIARGAKQLVKEGVVNSFSVGFRALEMDGNVITKAELYEISLVSVPANQEARIVATKALDGFNEDVVNELLGSGNKDEQIDELINKVAELELAIQKANDQAALAVKGLQHLNPSRSKPVVAAERLHMSKVIAKAADKLIAKQVSRKQAIDTAKIIKRSSEMLIRSHKKDL